MADLVFTTRGDVPREQLRFVDSQHEDEKAVYTRRDWFMGEEVVRSDAWVDMKRGESVAGQVGSL